MFLNKAGITISPTTESLHFIETTNCLSILSFLNKLKVALSRLRLYSHQLRIETGRYS